MKSFFKQVFKDDIKSKHLFNKKKQILIKTGNVRVNASIYILNFFNPSQVLSTCKLFPETPSSCLIRLIPSAGNTAVPTVQ